MAEVQQLSYYRKKAAELRAFAEKTSNFVLQDEVLKVAESFDKLADFAQKQTETSRR